MTDTNAPVPGAPVGSGPARRPFYRRRKVCPFSGANAPKIDQVIFGPFTFSIARKELRRGAEVIRLTDREQEIMVLFALKAGDTIPRHELIGDESEVGERTIDVQINRLRRKIEDDPGNPAWLQTVRGIGYRLNMD